MYKKGDVINGWELINDGNLPRLPHYLQPKRSPGVHVSGLLAKKHGYASEVIPETGGRGSTRAVSNLMELGLIFEDGGLKHRLNRVSPNRYLLDPPMLEKDGIKGSPDLYDIERSAYVDIKLSRKSATAAPGGKRFSYWEDQVKSYCYMDDCNVGQLMICHLMGMYKPGRQWDGMNDVVFNVWERVFTDEELIVNWSVLRSVQYR